MKKYRAFRNLLVILLTVAGLRTALADCQPQGTDGDDVIRCIGNDTDGVDVGRGNDHVTIVSGQTRGVLSHGGDLTVEVLPGATLGIRGYSRNAIRMIGDGSIRSTGRLVGDNGILLEGNGTISHQGDMSVTKYAVLATGNVSIVFIGNITVHTSAGIFVDASTVWSTIRHEGSIDGEWGGIRLAGNGAIHNVGDISVRIDSGTGIHLTADGIVIQEGDIVGHVGIVSGGDVIMRGSIHATKYGITVADGVVDFAGTIVVTDPDGTAIYGWDYGVQDLPEPASQVVFIDGEIDAPAAVRLNQGHDYVHITGASEISGLIDLGGGDDTIVVVPGAIINDSILGGEGAELVGDTFALGDGLYCGEDITANLLSESIGAALIGVDPDSGTVYYEGQVYQIEQFEQVVNGLSFYVCFPRMHDGRINAYDHGAPAALYCTGAGGVSVWDIDGYGNGTFRYAATAGQIESALEAARTGTANQLVSGDSEGNRLYALSDGQSLQFMGPELQEPEKTYRFIFDRAVCPQT
ncbi:MAG: hypothetical protein JNL42_22135 [Anaerolineae bacterium]|nr:hypothetical protein [Anaerolineae bacterium]